jgi:hypothetical protein
MFLFAFMQFCLVMMHLTVAFISLEKGDSKTAIFFLILAVFTMNFTILLVS